MKIKKKKLVLSDLPEDLRRRAISFVSVPPVRRDKMSLSQIVNEIYKTKDSYGALGIDFPADDLILQIKMFRV